jgi:purine-binding chemotaxis protein CheW
MSVDTGLGAVASPSSSEAASLATPSSPSQYLLFEWAGVLYGIEALAVREIQALPALAPLVESAPYLVGLLNLRGRLVPVLDLSRRLGQWPQPYKLEDNLVIVEHQQVSLAMIVHEVRGVHNLAAWQIEAMPLQNEKANPFVRGVAKVGGEMVMLLHLDRLWRDAEFHPSSFEAAKHEPTSSRFFLDNFSAEEQEVLRQRAQRLLPVSEAETVGVAHPVAFVELNGECYGIGLETVREFCTLRQISPVPCCPPHVLGQMNLRGDIVTLLDIQPLLQLPPRSNFRQGQVVVVQFQESSVGVLVDDVFDIAYLGAADVTPVSNMGSKYFAGSVLHEGKLIYLLDLPKMLHEGGLVVDEAV